MTRDFSGSSLTRIIFFNPSPTSASAINGSGEFVDWPYTSQAMRLLGAISAQTALRLSSRKFGRFVDADLVCMAQLRQTSFSSMPIKSWLRFTFHDGREAPHVVFL